MSILGGTGLQPSRDTVVHASPLSIGPHVLPAKKAAIP